MSAPLEHEIKPEVAAESDNTNMEIDGPSTEETGAETGAETGMETDNNDVNSEVATNTVEPVNNNETADSIDKQEISDVANNETADSANNETADVATKETADSANNETADVATNKTADAATNETADSANSRSNENNGKMEIDEKPKSLDNPENKDEPVDLEKVRAEFQEKARAYLIEQSRHVVIPSFAKWFDMNTIHSIEKKSFPDFFPVTKQNEEASGQPVHVSVYKTAETYRNMRDFMVNTYRINPVEYLTVTAVRRNLAGDVASIIRVHRFLEKWGLINYQIDPRTKPSLVGPQYTGHFQITLDTPKGLTPFVPEEISVGSGSGSSLGSGLAEQSDNNSAFSETEKTLTSFVEIGKAHVPMKEEEPSDAAIPLNVDVTRNIFNETTSRTPTTVTYLCNETANDISDVHYHNLKAKTSLGGNIGPSVISKECYEQGLFPSNFSASDFVKLENAQKQTDWSKQEVLLLLEGIEMYASIDSNPQSLFVNSNGQWDKISEHVASKTREECLIKFLHLPIEDRYLQKLVRGEEKYALDSTFSKDTIIQEVIAKLIEMPKGQEIISENARKNLQNCVLDQTNLVNQVVELTLEKFETKMSYIDRLEKDLARKEELLNIQRKQVLVERWLSFEKLNRFKNMSDPSVHALIDDLLTPEGPSGILCNVKGTVDHSYEALTKSLDPEQAENLPVSVAEPKAYQFWSA